MNKFLKFSVSAIMIGGLLIGCSNSETTETKEEVKSNKVAAKTEEEVVAKQETEEILPYETSENFGEWITKSIEILDGDLDDPRIEKSGNDEGFTYYLKANAVFDLQQKLNAWAKGQAIGQDMSNLHLQSTVLGHVQFVRTSHLGREGQAIESVELVEQWETLPEDMEDMRKAFENMEQILHDLDVVINHDGEGETYGVTHTLNGDNVSEIDRMWLGGGMPASELEIEMFVHGEDGVSAYDSIETYIKELSDNWAHDSGFRENQMDYPAEMQLAEYSLYEIAYFENEIEEMGMTEQFEDLRQTAFEMVKNDYDDGDTELHDELADKYEASLNVIIEEMESGE